ncbi:hypothetical protein CORC01_14329 [Colletotrichum orchidophilum]|uniref:Uncharacterized protein n=1 Tax=Colletotrichum orchidophilum TaxID=1209926 RepID=A0A1G4AMN1_9PEZI|nr:uncharacterized protein CORC01_14329 [Colletotrichum orchidophilum]OHE90381.1 hypothetical protein CORC01_14329 [Colletotrichum orchidophilum]
MTTTSDPNPMTTQRGAAPLTTVFTTPDFCNPLDWTNTITPPLSSVVCMPTSWRQVNDYSWGYYSPGICPSGYTEGCAFPTWLATSQGGFIGMGGPVTVGETPRLCCPTGYVCYTDTKSYGYSKCISTEPIKSYYNSNNHITTQLALVYAVQVRWASRDLSILETDPTVPGATYTGPIPTETGRITGSGTGALAGSHSNSGATAIPTTIPGGGSSSGEGGGISVGTTVAIAVGSVVGTLVLALLTFMILWRRRKRRHLQKLASGENSGGGGGGGDSDSKSDSVAPTMAHKAPVGKSSLDITSPSTARPGTGTTIVGDEPLNSPTTTTQLDSTTVMEMETMERPQELPDTNEVFEMEGDMPGPPLYREKEGWPLR